MPEGIAEGTTVEPIEKLGLVKMDFLGLSTLSIINDIPAGAVMSGFPARPHGLAKRAQMLAAELPDLFKRLRRLERALKNGGVGNRGEEDDGR